MTSYSTYAQKFSRKSVKKEWHIYSCSFVQDSHCYGFHIIPGSKGRKDPAAAVYTHMETPPNIFSMTTTHVALGNISKIGN